MPYRDPNNFSVLEMIIFAAFAGFGGLLAYLSRVIKTNERPRWLVGFIEMCGSAFVGVLAMLSCKALGLNWMWAGVVVGIFGWLGAEASIGILTRVLKLKLGLSNDKENHQ